jgi:hypothetical protein
MVVPDVEVDDVDVDDVDVDVCGLGVEVDDVDGELDPVMPDEDEDDDVDDDDVDVPGGAETTEDRPRPKTGADRSVPELTCPGIHRRMTAASPPDSNETAAVPDSTGARRIKSPISCA